MHLNFFKAKQKIEETVTTTEKTQLMSADMSQLFKLVETMRNTFSETRKKLKDIITAVSEDGKTTKNFELVLSQTLLKEADKYESNSLLHKVLETVGKVETTLSMEYTAYELRLDDEFRSKLIDLLDNKLSNLEKMRKKLSKARLHLDACKSRNRANQKDSTNPQKSNQYEVECEEAQNNFENLQDVFSTEVLNFIAREKMYADLYINMLEASRDYHMNAFKILDVSLPEIRKAAELSVYQPVFGLPLAKHKDIFGQEISFVLEECCEYILLHGLEIEGIFRIAGSSNRIKKLKAEFDAGVANLTADAPDVHTVASCMKNYLRELPEPILTFKLEEEWVESLKLEPITKISTMIDLTHRIPMANYINLKYLMCFLRKISARSEVNKMTFQNIGIVIGPNLLWSNNSEKQLAISNAASSICEVLLANYQQIFEIPR